MLPRSRCAVLALALGLTGCAELPPTRVSKVAFLPAGGMLQVELAGAADREQVLEALQKEAARWATCPTPSVIVSTIHAVTKPPADGKGEPSTSTAITGSFSCVAAVLP